MGFVNLDEPEKEDKGSRITIVATVVGILLAS